MGTQTVDFWQALGEQRIPWFFSDMYVKPKPVWLISGLGIVLVILAVVISWRRLRRRVEEWQKWQIGDTFLLISAVMAVVLGISPSSVVVICPRLLLRILGVSELSGLSPWGITFVVHTLRGLTYLAVLGVLTALLGTLALWPSWQHFMGLRKRYLFSVGLGFVSELDDGLLSTAMRAQFEAYDYFCAPKARVEVEQAGSRWTIVDGDNVYVVRRVNQTLNVYLKFRSFLKRSG